MKKLIIYCLAVVALAACDYLEPRPTMNLSTDELLETSQYGEGLLARAYSDLNTAWDIGSEYLTDNAVPSVPGTNVLALGGWTLDANPIGDWNGWYNDIRYLNYFIENCRDLVYSVSDPTRNATLQRNRIGEAYYLRAWYQWNLLKTYGGIAGSEALGFPIVTRVLSQDEDLDLPRDSYEDCVAQIALDLDSAVSILPLAYNGSTPYTNVTNRGRGSGSAALALKAKVYLYAASPAFGNSTQANWERAAQAAYDAIDAMGGLTSLAAYGNFNNSSSFDNIWIQPALSSSNNMERSYYPPSLYGNGTCNPSQNLVDAFPSADGYPIDESAVYNSIPPYSARDPSLTRFIFFNGDNYNNNYIRSYVDGPDAPGGLSQQGTRTGYYLKKLTSMNVRLTPGNVSSDIKFKVYLSKADLYLEFAEAANEAYGPDDASLGFSAADALGMIRERAGIDSDPGTGGYQDQYLDDQVAAGQAAFRTLVHNERRIELCFEGDRFWDIRRLNEPLSHTVKGVTMTYSGGVGPIPPAENIALASTPSADFVSPYSDISRINDGSTRSSGSFHNWPSSGLWRYIQLDFPYGYMQVPGMNNVYQLDSTTVRFYAPDAGVQFPDSAYMQIWDLDNDQWVTVWTDYDGVAEYADIQLSAVNTDKIRLNMKNNSVSTGVREWWVYGAPGLPPGYDIVFGDVETHTYQDFQRFVPLPYEQTLMMKNLKQNNGW